MRAFQGTRLSAPMSPRSFAFGLWTVGHNFGPILRGMGVPMATAEVAVRTDALGQVVTYVGAGIYEELLFRLIAMTLLNMLLVDALKMKVSVAIPIVIIASAILFSSYHYLSYETFDIGRFAFRTALGIYLAGIFIYRGFGIVVGAHPVYDLIVITLMHRAL